MDTEALKVLLESQERAYMSAMDTVRDQLNSQIKKLESQVSGLITSLEFTQGEVDDLKSKNKECQKELSESKKTVDKLTGDLESSNVKIKELENKVNMQEDYSRRMNIRISGVQEQNANETWEQTAAAVNSLIQDKMQLPASDLERAHRVGPRQDSKPRTIVARFSKYCDREAVMRNAGKLKGTNIFMNDDLCPASQAVRNAQMPLLRQAKAEGKIAFFRHTKLVIRERHNVPAAGGTQTGRGGGAEGGAAATVAGDGSSPDQRGDAESGENFPRLSSGIPPRTRTQMPSASASSHHVQSKKILRSTNNGK